MTHSSDPRNYARFIPAEELGDVAQWRFGAVGAAYSPAEMDARRAEAAQVQLQLQAASETSFERGLAQGRAEAKAEAQRLLLVYTQSQGEQAAQQLAAVIEAAHAALEGSKQTIAQGVLDLSCAIARQVIRHELSADPTALRHVIKEALDLLAADGKIATVRLNPQDLAKLQAPLSLMFAPGTMNLIADSALAAGGCLVESAGTVIDGRLEQRWQRAVSALGLSAERAGNVAPPEDMEPIAE